MHMYRHTKTHNTCMHLCTYTHMNSLQHLRVTWSHPILVKGERKERQCRGISGADVLIIWTNKSLWILFRPPWRNSLGNSTRKNKSVDPLPTFLCGCISGRCTSREVDPACCAETEQRCWVLWGPIKLWSSRVLPGREMPVPGPWASSSFWCMAQSGYQ